MNVQELITHLQTNYKPDQVIAYDIWSINDIDCLIADNGYNEQLPENLKETVLLMTQQSKDAEQGINWTVLDCHLQDVYEENNISLYPETV